MRKPTLSEITRVTGYNPIEIERGKKFTREELYGVPPDYVGISSTSKESFRIYKSVKKGQSSFRITKSLLKSLINTSVKIQKQPHLIITIPDGSDEYTINCQITKTINKAS